MSRAHCPTLAGPDGAEITEPPPPALPLLLPAAADPPAALPGNASVPPLQVEGVDLSGGLAAAFPGYADLRLLAPNAELRLLVAGLSSMVNQHNLRWAAGWAG
jgi:hypothetical protein